MAEQLNLAVEKRSTFGKGPARRLRAKSVVPGVYYSAEGENISVQVEELPLVKAYQKVGLSHVFTLDIQEDGQKVSKPVLIKKIVQHPFKSRITHVDFYGVDLTKEIQVSIPVEVTGRAKGVAVGGKLELLRESIIVQCLPMIVPDKLVLDVTELGVGESIHIKNVTLPEGVKAVYDDNFSIVNVFMEAAEAEEGAAEETKGGKKK